jgi:hypothetical protein
MLALNLSGKIFLKNESLIDKISDFKAKLSFDKLYMHLWESDYLKYKDQLKNIDAEYIVSKEPQFHKNIINQVSKNNHPYQDKIINNLYQFYGIEKVFDYSLYGNCDYFIRCRYDNLIKNKLKINLNLLNTNKPTAFVPIGGDWHSGLGDIFYLMNRSGAESMKDYLRSCIEAANDYPFHAETLFRFHLINKNNFNLYRFDYEMNFSDDKPYFANCNMPDLIIKDYLKAYQLFLFE